MQSENARRRDAGRVSGTAAFEWPRDSVPRLDAAVLAEFFGGATMAGWLAGSPGRVSAANSCALAAPSPSESCASIEWRISGVSVFVPAAFRAALTASPYGFRVGTFVWHNAQFVAFFAITPSAFSVYAFITIGGKVGNAAANGACVVTAARQNKISR